MNITITHDPMIAVATIGGDVSHAVAAEFQERLQAELTSTAALVLDFSGVNLLTSAGLRVLLLLHREATVAGRYLLLVAVPPNVRDVMEVTGFWDQFIHFPSLAEATVALGKRKP